MDVIYTDFAKEFDTGKHFTLVSILAALGFGYPLLSRFHFYLLNIPQWEELESSMTYNCTATLGVP